MNRSDLPRAMRWVICFSVSLILAAGCGDDSVTTPDTEVTDTTIFYVSATGNDTADGQSAATAFQTIGRALEAVRPGGEIRILPGTYRESLILDHLGSPEAVITLHGEGGRPILDGQRRESLGLWCEVCQNMVIENLEIRQYTDVGIGWMLSADIVLRDLVVHDNGFAVQLVDWELEGYGIHVENSERVTVDGNDVYRNGPQPQLPDRLMGTGINTFSCRDCVIQNNRSHENIGGGILVEDGVNVVVEGNEVESNDLDASVEEWWDGGIWIDGGRDIVVRDNTFRGNMGPGIEVSDEDHQSPRGYVLEGNVSTGNYFGIYIWNFGTSDFPPEEILRLSNNDFSGNSRQDIWIVPWECPPPNPCE